jgi:hypothetical protein
MMNELMIGFSNYQCSDGVHAWTPDEAGYKTVHFFGVSSASHIKHHVRSSALLLARLSEKVFRACLLNVVNEFLMRIQDMAQISIQRDTVKPTHCVMIEDH